MTPEFKALHDATRAVVAIEDKIKDAARLPDRFAYDVGSINITNTGGYYSSNKATEETFEAVKAVVKAFAEQRRREGEIERDRLLVEYSANIHALRATLPGLAAKASISLGVAANDLLPGGA